MNKCPYTGVNANREFRAVSRCPTVAVPTEQDGGPGTACGHWDEDCLGDELMTGVTGARTQILSKITIASLQDLGYQVDYSKADPFVFSDIASICTCRPPPPRTLMDMIQGETRQMGLGSSGRSRERPRRLSDAARAAAMAYGRKVLDEQSMSISKGIAKRQSTATVTYVGDQVVSVFMQDGDGIFDVVVRKGD